MFECLTAIWYEIRMQHRGSDIAPERLVALKCGIGRRTDALCEPIKKEFLESISGQI